MTTIEELQQIHDSLVYFKDDLTVIENEIDWSEVRNNPEYMVKFITEMQYVNRMNTIAREREWRARYHLSPFKANMMYERLTHPNAQVNEYGEVEQWGSAMTPEQWEVYKQHHDNIFETEYIDDNN